MSTVQAVVAEHPQAVPMQSDAELAMDCKLKKILYGSFLAVRDSHVPIHKGRITGFIGPSGCGKSTVLRSLNRMNDLIHGFRLEGDVHFLGQDIYGKSIDPVVVRRYIGMVFQQPNPFAMSIFDNVAFGLRLNRFKGDVAQRFSGGQQQRLCIARAVATEPIVLLMDEPCSALDPIATRHIEALMIELKKDYTIVLVTHNMQQATRVADITAFFAVDISKGGRTGYLVEIGPTHQAFNDPRAQLTKEYISGKFS